MGMMVFMHHWENMRTSALHNVVRVWINLLEAILQHTIVNCALRNIGINPLELLLVTNIQIVKMQQVMPINCLTQGMMSTALARTHKGKT